MRVICAAITKHGPLVTRYPAATVIDGEDMSGQPIIEFEFGKGRSKDVATTPAAGLTCELLWTASQHKGDCETILCFFWISTTTTMAVIHPNRS